MSDFRSASSAKNLLARTVSGLPGINGVGIDVRGGGDFGVRVNILASAPRETVERIPEVIDNVTVEKVVVGPLSSE